MDARPPSRFLRAKAVVTLVLLFIFSGLVDSHLSADQTPSGDSRPIDALDAVPGLGVAPEIPPPQIPPEGIQGISDLLPDRQITLMRAAAELRCPLAGHCSIRFSQQAWWPEYALLKFTIDPFFHASPWTYYVAISNDGATAKLTGDAPASALDLSSAVEFNRISGAQRIRLHNLTEAKRYATFFLGVFFANSGVYMRSRDVTACTNGTLISDDDGNTRRSAIRYFQRISRAETPRVLLRTLPDGSWAGSAYQCKWWCDEAVRYDLEVTTEGRTAIFVHELNENE